MEQVEQVSIVTQELDFELVEQEYLRVFLLWRGGDGKSAGSVFHIQQAQQNLGVPAVELEAEEEVGGGVFQAGEQFFGQFGRAEHPLQEAEEVVIVKHERGGFFHIAAEVVVHRDTLAEGRAVGLCPVGHLEVGLLAGIEVGEAAG